MGCPRSLLKIRPSAAMPKVSMCWRRMATSSGGMGTRRASLAGRCLSPRSSVADAVSVQAPVDLGPGLLQGETAPTGGRQVAVLPPQRHCLGGP